MLAKQVGKRAKFVGDDTIAVYVDRIGQMVARNSDVRMPVTFRVIDDDSVRAFTLPGGYQYINRGLLLRIKSEAELAGVLAHGIAHTALRSATKEAAQGDIVQMAMIPMMTSADWPGTAPRPAEANVEAAKALYSYFNLGAKRTQELAADYFGLQYVYVTGYDPEGYLDILERVSTQTRSSAASTDVFSASPPLDQRTEAMRKEIAKILPKRSDAVVSTPEFKEFQEQVRAWKANPK
ncbi:MAG TPA: M48 family metalloprotease [Candidatus Acidoferrum sp.]|nr:M48 family metalloprotease [Candidatus Acidoferrum sp.]